MGEQRIRVVGLAGFRTHVEPPIWRRLVVSGQVTLFGLHRMLQFNMGWENYHLHQFIVGTARYGEPIPRMSTR